MTRTTFRKTSPLKLALISGLLLSVAGIAHAKAPTSTPALLEKGKTSFTTNCATCHGDKGDGNGPAGQYMTPKPRDYSKDKFKKGDKVEQIFATVTSGLPGTSMVGFGHLSEEERWALAYYVKQLQKAKK